MMPKAPSREPFRVMIGGPQCSQLHSASVFNISADELRARCLRMPYARSAARARNLVGSRTIRVKAASRVIIVRTAATSTWEIGSGRFRLPQPGRHCSLREKFAEAAALDPDQDGGNPAIGEGAQAGPRRRAPGGRR